jgi:hypothetical protein
MTKPKPKPKEKSGWIYYIENGERKRKLKIATVTGAEARALCNDMVDLIRSFNSLLSRYLL